LPIGGPILERVAGGLMSAASYLSTVRACEPPPHSAACGPQLVRLLLAGCQRLFFPAHVRRFLARRRALALDYLIGGVRELRSVWKAFGILAAVNTGNADIHVSDLRVIDRHGVWVSTQHAGVDLKPANLAHDAVDALERS
jgi:hypothetical protein